MNGKEAMSFLHDSNSRHDPKMLKLWTKFDYTGIGIFWCIVEILREQPDFKYSLDDTHLIGIELRVDKVLINDLIRYCLQPDVSLFMEQDGCFFSESLLRRMEKFKNAHLRMSLGGKLGMKNRYTKDNSKVDITTLKGTYKVGCKVKEKKRKETNLKSLSFSIPTLEEIKAYISEKKYNVNPEKWLAHYEANGWMVGKNKMKDWRAAIRTWTHSEFNNNHSSLNIGAPRSEPEDIDPWEKWMAKIPAALEPLAVDFEALRHGKASVMVLEEKLLGLFADDQELKVKQDSFLRTLSKSHLTPATIRRYRLNYIIGKFGIPQLEEGK